MNQRDITESLLRTIDIISNNSAVNTSNSQPRVLTAEVTDITQRTDYIYGVTYQGRQIFVKSSSNFLYEKGDNVLILFPTADEGDPNVVLVGPAATTDPNIPTVGDLFPISKSEIKKLFNKEGE